MGRKKVVCTWIGSSHLGYPASFKKKAQQLPIYNAVRVQNPDTGDFICGVGDYVLLASEEEEGEPFVARVLDMFEDARSKKFISVQWLYRPNDLSADIRPRDAKQKSELFYATEHIDRVETDTILELFRIRFTLNESGQKENFTSPLYSDDKDTTQVLDTLYECSRIYDLGSSSVNYLTREQFEEIKNPLVQPLAPVGTKKSPSSPPATKTVTTRRSEANVPATTTTTTTTTTSSIVPTTTTSSTSSTQKKKEEDKLSSQKDINNNNTEASKKKPVDPPKRPRKSSTPEESDKEATSKKKQKMTGNNTVSINEQMKADSDSEIKKQASRENQAPENSKAPSSTVPSSNNVEIINLEKDEQPASSSSKIDETSKEEKQETVTTTSTSNPRNPAPSRPKSSSVSSVNRSSSFAVPNLSSERLENEQLWSIFQECREIVGSELALEVLGYLKLEIITKNQSRPLFERMCAPSFILKALTKPELKQITEKICQLFGLSSHIMLPESPNPLGLRRALAELEKARPGVIFDLFTGESSESNFLSLPRKIQTPIFGIILGVDGFSAVRVIYQKQIMIVPIERDGSVLDATTEGFRKLVSTSFKFNLVHVGDFEFLIAPIPGETSEQIFVKTATGRTISLTVPVTKAKLAFVKCLISHHEGVSPSQISFSNSNGGYFQDDQIQLSELNIKDFSVIHLAPRPNSI